MSTSNSIPQVSAPLPPSRDISSSTSSVTSSERLPENLPDLPSDGQKVPPGLQEQESAPATREAVKEAVKQLNEYAKSSENSLSFSVDEVLNQTVIKVVNTKTQELVRQIPSKEALTLARHIELGQSAILDALA